MKTFKEAFTMAFGFVAGFYMSIKVVDFVEKQLNKEKSNTEDTL